MSSAQSVVVSDERALQSGNLAESSPVFQITSKWAYLRLQKVANTSKFWDKDVSKRPEFH